MIDTLVQGWRRGKIVSSLQILEQPVSTTCRGNKQEVCKKRSYLNHFHDTNLWNKLNLGRLTPIGRWVGNCVSWKNPIFSECGSDAMRRGADNAPQPLRQWGVLRLQSGDLGFQKADVARRFSRDLEMTEKKHRKTLTDKLGEKMIRCLVSIILRRRTKSDVCSNLPRNLYIGDWRVNL